ncbi:hypothetical protein [Clostridium sp. HBUAS56010]|uniref:hypothetical protein n=1 Tax=Clostridium sp. HBUAS56010 TaxID=2571127 RepID=UPI0011789FC9|nr:hypothetical protein [Clostridium sp. HBUAS56010]
MKRYMEHLLHSAEKRVDIFLNTQVKEERDPFYGGMKRPVLDCKPTVYVMADAAAVYLNPDSRYYKDEILLKAMESALIFIRNCQREDGSFDYPSCNFLSAPDTSFCFKRLIATYRLFYKFTKEEELRNLKAGYRFLLTRGLHALLNGGFHTPNHRWAIAAALMQGAHLLEKENPDFSEKLGNRADLYLMEGIDGNEDGEYAERSTGNYNAVVNSAMLSMYEETGDETYLGYVERNLKMMLYYIDPDDTIFTQNSTRQDQGRADYADKYFYQYLYLAARTGNEVFDKAAHKIIKDNMARGDMAPECLHILMLHDIMKDYEFKGYGFLDTYHKHFLEAGVIRGKTPQYGYSILKGKRGFLYLKFGKTLIYLKIGESYCSIRNFIPQTMEETKDGCILTSVEKGWYYLPFKEKQDTSDWWNMDHKKREILNSSQICMTVTVKELTDGMEVNVKSDGLDRVPLRVEICIPSGSILENEHFYFQTAKGGEMVLRDGYLTLNHENESLLIGPGYGTHEFGGHYSGEEVNETGFTIYFNDYTPYERTFFIRRKPL